MRRRRSVIASPRRRQVLPGHRPSPRRRPPTTTSRAAPDGGRGGSATANNRPIWKAKNRPAKPGGFVLQKQLARCHSRLQVGGVDLLVESGVQPLVIEFTFPPRHH